MNAATVDPEPRIYTRHIVAFVDILGFKAMIDQVEHGTLHPDLLNECLSFSESLGALTPRCTTTIMSDAIVLSHVFDTRRTKSSGHLCWSTEEKVQNILEMLTLLSFRFLRLGVFVRGAVTIGNLYHRGNVVFGDALVKAYLTETNKAVFPRIIVSPEVLPFAPHSMIRRHGDEHSFIHILHVLDDLQEMDEGTRTIFRGKFRKIRNAIQTRLEECSEQKIYQKIRWFAEYWNSCCPDLPDLPELSKIKI